MLRSLSNDEVIAACTLIVRISESRLTFPVSNMSYIEYVQGRTQEESELQVGSEKVSDNVVSPSVYSRESSSVGLKFQLSQ